jgi:hypothetical protein
LEFEIFEIFVIDFYIIPFELNREHFLLLFALFSLGARQKIEIEVDSAQLSAGHECFLVDFDENIGHNRLLGGFVLQWKSKGIVFSIS